jgi:hypothetical protein
LCIVHCALCIVHCALCIVHCALCIVHCALCIVHCALCIVHCALCIVIATKQDLSQQHRSAWTTEIIACAKETKQKKGTALWTPVAALAFGRCLKLMKEHTTTSTPTTPTSSGETKLDYQTISSNGSGRLWKYIRMLNIGVPIEAVKQKMKINGVTPIELDEHLAHLAHVAHLAQVEPPPPPTSSGPPPPPPFSGPGRSGLLGAIQSGRQLQSSRTRERPVLAARLSPSGASLLGAIQSGTRLRRSRDR